MKPIRKLLLPVEFSPVCARAREHAVALARQHDAELHVVHVQVLHGGQYSLAGVPNIADMDEEVATANTRQLAAFVKDIGGHVVTASERDISAAPSILRYAEEQSIDLIVLGTHARRNISRLFMGSVAAEVVRRAIVPVLIIGPEGDQEPGEYRRILAPQDFSERSLDALRQAGEMSRHHDGTLSVLHVIDPDSLPPYFNYVFTDAERERARALLEERLTAEGLPDLTEIVVKIGPPDRCIADHAIDHAVDLVVMGRTGQTALEHFLIGSTTERVLRRAPCPVLVHCQAEPIGL